MAMIPGHLLEGITQAILQTFSDRELARVLRFRMDVWLDRIAGRGPFLDVVDDVLAWAQRDDRDAELVRVLAQARPRNAALQHYYRQCGMAVPVTVTAVGVPAAPAPPGPVDVGDAGLQALVRARLPTVDLSQWQDRLAQVEARVCRITIDGHSAGTGFLVGPQAVLTNHHVIKTEIKNVGTTSQIQCVFDYKLLPAGGRSATIVNLAPADWLVDSSPPTAGEVDNDPNRTQPTTEELDYAVLRLAEPVSEARGWERIPLANPTFEPKMALLIPQHPDGQPLRLAVDTDAIDRDAHLWLNGNHTRIRYAASTSRGSSGSPCFDMNWNLVAVHHYGDEGSGQNRGYNQGVPVGPIGRRLRDPNRDPQVVQALQAVIE